MADVFKDDGQNIWKDDTGNLWYKGSEASAAGEKNDHPTVANMITIPKIREGGDLQ